MHYWLVKTEPTAYSIDDLPREPAAPRGTASAITRPATSSGDQMSVGDGVLVYHSNADPTGIVGLAKVRAPPHADATALAGEGTCTSDPKATRDNPIWMAVDLQFVEKFAHPVTLAQLRRPHLWLGCWQLCRPAPPLGCAGRGGALRAGTAGQGPLEGGSARAAPNLWHSSGHPMVNGKKVVVVMPAYNAAQTLVPTYNEVMEQGIVDLVILVDDASRDQTTTIAKSLPNTLVHHATPPTAAMAATRKPVTAWPWKTAGTSSSWSTPTTSTPPSSSPRWRP